MDAQVRSTDGGGVGRSERASSGREKKRTRHRSEPRRNDRRDTRAQATRWVPIAARARSLKKKTYATNSAPSSLHCVHGRGWRAHEVSRCALAAV